MRDIIIAALVTLLFVLTIIVGINDNRFDRRITALENRLIEVYTTSWVSLKGDDGDSVCIRITPNIKEPTPKLEIYRPKGNPPSYAKPESYHIILGTDSKYYMVLVGGSIVDIPYNSYKEAQEAITKQAQMSMERWLTYGGF